MLKHNFIMLIILLSLPLIGFAQESEERRAKPVLSNNIYRTMNKAQEAIQNEDYVAALAVLDELLARGDRLVGYDRAKTLHLKTIIFIRQEKYAEAITTCRQAIAQKALEIETEQDLRYTLVRMLFILERYDEALSALEMWLDEVETLNAESAFTAAQLYMTVDQLTQAQHYAELGMTQHKQDQLADTTIGPRENWYRLLLSVYGRQQSFQQAAAVAVECLSLWPDKLEYYHQLSGLYQQLEQDREAWAILDIAFHNELINSGDDYSRLLQMHRFFGYPYRGAVLFSTAIEQGQVEKTEENWESLANAWLQARQWQLAEPALIAAANLSDNGKHWLRLCQTNFNRELWQQSLSYCKNALDKGGLGDEIGTTWQLMAMVNFSTNNYQEAARYLRRCSDHEATKNDCSQRLAYVNQVVEFEQIKQTRARQQREIMAERRRNRDQLVEEAILMTD